VGFRLQLRKPEVYMVVDRRNLSHGCLFDDEDTISGEKLDDTNMIDPLQIIKGKIFIIEWVLKAIDKKYLKIAGEHAGEVIVLKPRGNPYKLSTHDLTIKYSRKRLVEIE